MTTVTLKASLLILSSAPYYSQFNNNNDRHNHSTTPRAVFGVRLGFGIDASKNILFGLTMELLQIARVRISKTVTCTRAQQKKLIPRGSEFFLSRAS